MIDIIKNPIYMAGLFDGEGCVCIWKKRGNCNYYLMATITQKNNDFINLINSVWKGSICKRDSSGEQVVWNGLKAKDFLTTILPYTIIKRSQIILALEFIDTLQDSNYRMTTELYERRMNIYSDLRKLQSTIRGTQ